MMSNTQKGIIQNLKLRAKEKSFPFLFIQNAINSAFAKNFEKCYSSYCLLGGYLPSSTTYTSLFFVRNV